MIIVIVQARIGSTRLPGKVLMPLAGKSLISHVFDRLRPSSKVDRLVLATTTSPQDDILEQWAQDAGVDIYRGSEHDVLDRYYQAAKIYSPKIVVRITADDPFKDFRMLDEMLTVMEAQHLDFISNNNPPSFPEGMDIEIMTFATLERAAHEAREPLEREHVTQYIYRNKDQFKILNFDNGKNDLSSLRWTIDTISDMKMAEQVYTHLYSQNPLFQHEDILQLLEKKPIIAEINSGENRSAMYKK